jgi:hypothetical protein
MKRRLATAAAILAVLAPLLAGCGGSKNTAQELPPPPTLTVPGEGKAPNVPDVGTTGTTGATGPSSTSAPTSTTPAATSDPGTAQGGAAAPQTGGATPDSPQNDQKPAAGTPADKFESFCNDNPGAC